MLAERGSPALVGDPSAKLGKTEPASRGTYPHSGAGCARFLASERKRGHMAELLDTLSSAWLLGGVGIGVWHEWWRRRAVHLGESAWRSRIGEELVYIWFGGIVVFGMIRWLLGESPPPDPSDFYPG